MTAEGLLCREYLGWKRQDTRLRKVLSTCWKTRSIGRIATCTTGTTPRRRCITWKIRTGIRGIRSCGKSLPQNQILEGPEKGSWAGGR